MEKGWGKDPARKGSAAFVSDWKGGLWPQGQNHGSWGPVRGVGVRVSPVLPEAEFKCSMEQEMGQWALSRSRDGSCLISLEFRRVGGSELPVPQVTLHLSPISVSPWCLFFFSARLSHTTPVSPTCLSPLAFSALHFSPLICLSLCHSPLLPAATRLPPAVPPCLSLSCFHTRTSCHVLGMFPGS